MNTETVIGVPVWLNSLFYYFVLFVSLWDILRN